MTDAIGIASIDEHHGGAYGFTMKSRADGALYRVFPMRDPAQPRFWCIVVVRCTAGGMLDHSESGWIGSRGHRREDLAAIMNTIRDDLDSWLAAPAQDALLAWIRPLPS